MDKRIYFIGIAGVIAFAPNLALAEGNDYKKVIEKLHDKEMESEDPNVNLHLAQAYFLDQNLEMSIKEFLKALDRTHIEGRLVNETLTYRQALDLYLSGTQPKETSLQLLEKYIDYFRKHPEDAGIGFLLAAAYANLRDYEMFYQTFYSAFLQDPTHYLADKTRAALHIKLYERSRTDDEKSNERELIRYYTKRAIKNFIEDSTLYVWLVTFSEGNERAVSISQAIMQLCGQNRPVPRNDIPFYVQQAIDTKQFDLAERFINAAKGWYRYSRFVEAAQQHLENVKAK